MHWPSLVALVSVALLEFVVFWGLSTMGVYGLSGYSGPKHQVLVSIIVIEARSMSLVFLYLPQLVTDLYRPFLYGKLGAV